MWAITLKWLEQELATFQQLLDLFFATFVSSNFTPWSGEAVIYRDTGQHLHPSWDQIPTSCVEGMNDDHSATTAHIGKYQDCVAKIPRHVTVISIWGMSVGRRNKCVVSWIVNVYNVRSIIPHYTHTLHYIYMASETSIEHRELDHITPLHYIYMNSPCEHWTSIERRVLDHITPVHYITSIWTTLMNIEHLQWLQGVGSHYTCPLNYTYMNNPYEQCEHL